MIMKNNSYENPRKKGKKLCDHLDGEKKKHLKKSTTKKTKKNMIM